MGRLSCVDEMSALALLAPPRAIPSDREWFADHGRRDIRFRPALPGEPDGWGFLVRRDGRQFSWPVSGPAAFDINDAPDLLEVLFKAFLTVTTREKAADAPPSAA